MGSVCGIADLTSNPAAGWLVWLELGLQSAFDETLDRVNRGHGADVYFREARRARALGLKTPDEALGKTDFDFLPREEASQNQANEKALMQADKPLLNQEQVLLDAAGKKCCHCLSRYATWPLQAGW